jgi:hypothetical protein
MSPEIVLEKKVELEDHSKDGQKKRRKKVEDNFPQEPGNPENGIRQSHSAHCLAKTNLSFSDNSGNLDDKTEHERCKEEEWANAAHNGDGREGRMCEFFQIDLPFKIRLYAVRPMKQMQDHC